MVAGKIADMKAGTRTDLAPIGARLETSTSRAEAAKLMNVSERSVTRAKAVRANGAPELKQAVESGRVSLRSAEVIAHQPEQEQREIVQRGEQAIAIALLFAAFTSWPSAPAAIRR